MIVTEKQARYHTTACGGHWLFGTIDRTYYHWTRGLMYADVRWDKPSGEIMGEEVTPIALFLLDGATS